MRERGLLGNRLCSERGDSWETGSVVRERGLLGNRLCSERGDSWETGSVVRGGTPGKQAL